MRRANTKEILADLWNTFGRESQLLELVPIGDIYLPYDAPLQFRRIATGSANAIFAGVQLFIAFFGFFPTYELGEKTEGQG